MVVELTTRQQAILGLVIREYVTTAVPVGSRGITEQYGLGVSSATVRNEMAYLEELGYLTHPHTSAGRVPTEKGYRYFVQRLMGDIELPLAEQRMILHQFYQVRLDLEQCVRLAAAVLARTAHTAAVVTSPRPDCCRFKHVELISTHGPLVLLVLVLEKGLVKEQMLLLNEGRSQEDLSRVSNWLNDAFCALTADEIAAEAGPLPEFERKVGDVIAEIMRSVDRLGGEIYHDGLLNVVDHPDFVASEGLQQVLHVLEERVLLEAILGDVLAMTGKGVQVIIGGEGGWDELSECSLVLSRYGVSGQATGALGVLGPIRMPYERAVSTVGYVSRLLSDLLFELYGG
ncbi:MAG: heat-inducible transcriptional repressor HrcA [Chloroflexota bacterium]|nr:heat-inducible transcriptional repressor HrcA [Chloroflexota bacterium]